MILSRSHPYTVHYVIAGSTRGELFVDEAARDAEVNVHQAQLAYLEAMRVYRQERLSWLEAARVARRAGEPIPQVAEPLRPARFTTFSVGLQRGFPLLLEAGDYQIRMRGADGAIIAGSQRTLHVFAARQTALGFEVIPEEQWTSPEQVNDAKEVIIAEPGSVIYLKPRLVQEYPALAVERLRDNQFSGDVVYEWRWLPDASQADSFADVLEVIRHGQVVERIDHAPYTVRYGLNKELAYEILPYDANNRALTPRVDFAGYRLQLPPGSGNFTIRLGLPDSSEYAGNVRRVWVLPADLLLYVIASIAAVLVTSISLLVIWRHRAKRL